MNFLEISGLVAWGAYLLGALAFIVLLVVRFREVRKPRNITLSSYARQALHVISWPVIILYCAKDEL